MSGSALRLFDPSEVWITGLGLVGPLGLGSAASLAALEGGATGARALEGRGEGDVCGVFPAAVLPDPDERRALQLARTAADEAMSRAFGGAERGEGEFGLCLAVGAPLPTELELELDRLPLLDAEGQVDPAKAAAALRTRPAARDGRHEDHPHALLAHRFGLDGPQAVLRGWTGGSDAVALGAAWIRRGRCRFVLAGGVEAALHSFGLVAFQGRTAAPVEGDPATAVRPFDRARRGPLPAEGAAVFVLESARSAADRGAPCLARVLGTGAGLGTGGREGALRRALEEGRADAVDAVLADGRADVDADRAEADCLSAVLGPDGPPVTATKGAWGHAGAAAAALDLGLAVELLAAGRLPAVRNLEAPDPDCPLDLVAGGPRRGGWGRLLCCASDPGGAAGAVLLGRGEP